MAIETFTMGPGSLTLNPGVGARDASAQVTNMRVEWDESVKTSDAVPVLSGEELAPSDDASYSAKLVGNLLQDISAAGFLSYTWEHRGEEVPFEFVPNTAAGRAVSGTVRIVPMTLGGDVKGRNGSDISWSIIGYPDLDDLPVGP